MSGREFPRQLQLRSGFLLICLPIEGEALLRLDRAQRIQRALDLTRREPRTCPGRVGAGVKSTGASRWVEETDWRQPAWDEVAIGLEIGVQPRVEIRCVKQTGCCVKCVDP